MHRLMFSLSVVLSATLVSPSASDNAPRVIRRGVGCARA